MGTSFAMVPRRDGGYFPSMKNFVDTLARVDVLDLSGAPCRVGALWSHGPAVIVFLRHYG